MKLTKFRIKGYKSIVDSGDCYLTDTITILAGKNESGKTSILEALEDFSAIRQIRENAKPINNKEITPTIQASFSVSGGIIKDVLEAVGDDRKEIGEAEIEIVKTFPKTYTVQQIDANSDLFLRKEIEDKQRYIKDNWAQSTTLFVENEKLREHLFEFDFQKLRDSKASFKEFLTMIEAELPNFSEGDRGQTETLLNTVKAGLEELESIVSRRKKIESGLIERIPNFILFSSFEDVFPNSIPFPELEKNSWIRDLSVISDLDVKTIQGSIDREKRKHKTEINIRLNKDYERFWTQDVSKLTVDWDSGSLWFWIEEDGYPYEPSLRSKGRQWHLAFYIKVSARAKEEVTNIILIDEPGLFLHAKAQENILSKLEDSSTDAQIVFSTHSPYLLEADKLNRIRLVHREREIGTRIENKVHALADKETLTPILTAIGLELSSGINSIDKKENVVVEGPSDVYYLNAFKLLLKSSVNFIFGGGSGNMPIVGTILHGWGTRVIYLYDNDQGKKDGEKNLERNWDVDESETFSVLEKRGSIEDLFSPEDFREHVLEGKHESYTEANSEYIKKKKIDKVLLSKKFLERCQTGKHPKLGKATVDNVQRLFDRIDKTFTRKDDNAS